MKIEEEGARGIGIDPEVANPLIQLMREAYDLGSREGFRVYREYPQCEPVRLIGEKINSKGGFKAMQRYYYYIRAREYFELSSMLEGFWDHIGKWQK